MFKLAILSSRNVPRRHGCQNHVKRPSLSPMRSGAGTAHTLVPVGPVLLRSLTTPFWFQHASALILPPKSLRWSTWAPRVSSWRRFCRPGPGPSLDIVGGSPLCSFLEHCGPLNVSQPLLPSGRTCLMTCLPRNIGSCLPTLDADKAGPATPFVTPQGNLMQGSPLLF